MTALRPRLVALLRRLGATAEPGPLADAVLAAWSEPARRYHDLEHLRACLSELDRAPTDGTDRERVEAALWFHDAIYDPHATDNEERSAQWAREGLAALGVSPEVAGDVDRLVRLTRHTAPAPDPEGQFLCDIDLAVLGSGPEAFELYERRIRAEYGWVPDAAFRVARREVLVGLLARSPLYQTGYFRNRLESVAKENLGRALARLGSAR
jgi:predicted metal-dependent HD superfamily phosphohydrolase